MTNNDWWNLNMLIGYTCLVYLFLTSNIPNYKITPENIEIKNACNILNRLRFTAYAAFFAWMSTFIIYLIFHLRFGWS